MFPQTTMNRHRRSRSRRAGKRIAVLLLGVTGLAGCQHARIELAGVAPDGAAGEKPSTESATNPTQQRRIVLKQQYFLMGLLPRWKIYEEQQLCPERGIRTIHQYDTFSDALLEQLTLGIYAPRTLEILCQD